MDVIAPVVAFYPTQFITGKISPVELPLRSVSCGGGFGDKPGTLSAQLDLREVSGRPDGDWASAEMKALQGWLKPGLFSIVGIRETPAGQDVLSEWLITATTSQYSDPIVQISGAEITSYLTMDVLRQTQKERSGDTMRAAQALIIDHFHDIGQIWSPGEATSTIRQPIDLTQHAVTTAEAVRTLQGDDWEWLCDVYVTNESVTRQLKFAQPTVATIRDDVVLEATRPGEVPASVADYQTEDHIEDLTVDLWCWGAGQGSGQVREQIIGTATPGQPHMGAAFSATDALTREQLRREGQRALTQMRKRAFTAEVYVDRLPRTPRVGDVYHWRTDGSISMPDAETGRVRVLGWQWSKPSPGQRETITLSLERWT